MLGSFTAPPTCLASRSTRTYRSTRVFAAARPWPDTTHAVPPSIEASAPCAGVVVRTTILGMTNNTPAAIVAAVNDRPELPPGDDERFAGFGIMGLPFVSGHYLALRQFPVASFAPAYASVWHRDPAGRWTFLRDHAWRTELRPLLQLGHLERRSAVRYRRRVGDAVDRSRDHRRSARLDGGVGHDRGHPADEHPSAIDCPRRRGPTPTC